VAIKTQCEHILCLECLKTWILSKNENAELCPLCRAELPPPNPGPKVFTDWMEELEVLKSDTEITPLARAQGLLEAFGGFLDGFPFFNDQVNWLRYRDPPAMLQDVYNTCQLDADDAGEFEFRKSLIYTTAWVLADVTWERLELAVEIAGVSHPTDDTTVRESQEIFTSRKATQWYLRAEMEMRSLVSASYENAALFLMRHRWSTAGSDEESDSSDSDEDNEYEDSDSGDVQDDPADVSDGGDEDLDQRPEVVAALEHLRIYLQ